MALIVSVVGALAEAGARLPQLGVDGEPGRRQGFDRVTQRRVGITDVVRPTVGGQVVDKPPSHALAEGNILTGAQERGCRW
ncbi:MAG: hypothetical protein JO272_17495 [Pseudonocardiales bacterium]|nr:hypothetical protein [Pseudonocardiales bacterium]